MKIGHNILDIRNVGEVQQSGCSALPREAPARSHTGYASPWDQGTICPPSSDQNHGTTSFTVIWNYINLISSFSVILTEFLFTQAAFLFVALSM